METVPVLYLLTVTLETGKMYQVIWAVDSLIVRNGDFNVSNPNKKDLNKQIVVFENMVQLVLKFLKSFV